MKFTSYAQNFEDVMLWRALKEVKEGFYIDVGAQDHISDSVTKAFYDRGWHGINIEPATEYIDKLSEYRQRDINLGCALGARKSTVEFWEVNISGLSTADEDVIKRHLESGIKGTFRQVMMRTLADVCKEFVTSEIHFLKIDVEGLEAAVLEGGDFLHFRPWIVIVEATSPNTSYEVHERWEHFLTSARYAFCYKDGLNRFYIANEKAELAKSFESPPNVFDDFELYSYTLAESQIQVHELDERAKLAESQVFPLNERANYAEAQVRELKERANFVETQVIRSEERANSAEAQVRELNVRAAEADAQVRELNVRAAEADAQVRELKERANFAEAQVIRSEERANFAEAQVKESNVRAAEAEAQILVGHQQLEIIYRSRSWRLTAPSRWFLLQCRLMFRNGPRSRMIALTRRIKSRFVSSIVDFSRKHPLLKRRLMLVAHRFGLDQRLERLYRKITGIVATRGLVNVSDGESFWILGQEVMGPLEWQTKSLEISQKSPDTRYPPSFKGELARRRRENVKVEEAPSIPRASVVASLYRSEEFLDSYLGNLLEQTIFEQCEICIVSVDPSSLELDLLTSFAGNFPNVRLKINPDLIGIYAAWNIAIKMSRAPYITNANADDLRRRDSLELQVKVLDQFPSIDVVYQDVFYAFRANMSWDHVAAIGARSKLPHVTLASLLLGINSPHNAPMWRKDLHAELGYFDESFQSVSDYYFWLKCAAAGKQFFKIREPHVSYFFNPRGMSTRENGPGLSEAEVVKNKYSQEMGVIRTISQQDRRNPLDHPAEQFTIEALNSLYSLRMEKYEE